MMIFEAVWHLSQDLREKKVSQTILVSPPNRHLQPPSHPASRAKKPDRSNHIALPKRFACRSPGEVWAGRGTNQVAMFLFTPKLLTDKHKGTVFQNEITGMLKFNETSIIKTSKTQTVEDVGIQQIRKSTVKR